MQDVGAGNGGFLWELKKRHVVDAWGYDLMPENIEHAQKVYDVDVSFMDVTKGVLPFSDIVVATEILEHLVDPHGMVGQLRSVSRRFIVASSPAFETPVKHYEYHLWCWMADSYVRMFERAGWKILRHYITPENGTQFILAETS